MVMNLGPVEADECSPRTVALHLVGEQESGWVEPVLVKSRFEVLPGPAALVRQVDKRSGVQFRASRRCLWRRQTGELRWTLGASRR